MISISCLLGESYNAVVSFCCHSSTFSAFKPADFSGVSLQYISECFSLGRRLLPSSRFPFPPLPIWGHGRGSAVDCRLHLEPVPIAGCRGLGLHGLRRGDVLQHRDDWCGAGSGREKGGGLGEKCCHGDPLLRAEIHCGPGRINSTGAGCHCGLGSWWGGKGLNTSGGRKSAGTIT